MKVIIRFVLFLSQNNLNFHYKPIFVYSHNIPTSAIYEILYELFTKLYLIITCAPTPSRFIPRLHSIYWLLLLIVCPKMAPCVACQQELPREGREFLKCSECNNCYDLTCGNVSERRFYGLMTPEHKKTWKCPPCLSKIPIPNKTNLQFPPSIQSHSFDQNVTIRKKTRNVSINVSSDDDSYNTVMNQSFSQSTQTDEYQIPPSTSTETSATAAVTIENISNLLDTKLLTIEKSITKNLKQTIHKEIQLSIEKLRDDLTENTDILANEQQNIKENLTSIENKIQKLTAENLKLTQEIQDIAKNNTNLQLNEEDDKKIYGLPEKYNEQEEDLYEVATNIFQDIINIDINPYLDEIKRIGKKGKRRPLTLELTSKRLKKYILQNSVFFKNTGLSISNFKSGDALDSRNHLIRKLKEARQNGKHAIIRSNKLFNEGQEYKEENQKETTMPVSIQITQDVYNNQKNTNQATNNHNFRD